MEIFGLYINFDFSWVATLGNLPLHLLIWHFFLNGGWIMFAVVFIWGIWKNYVFYKSGKFYGAQTFVLLSIDIPRNNIQTPKAVENFFTALAGAHMPLEWHEKNIEGKFQLGFSCEIVSIDGHIQFLVRTPSQWRELAESALYAQYPEAEITEVEDYLDPIQDIRFPNDEYNFWGSDLVLVSDQHIPIRTYMDFQEVIDNEWKDPLASMLEIMSKTGPGEQIWFHIIVYPADNIWHVSGKKALNKVLGIKETAKKNILDKASDVPLQVISRFGEELLGKVEEGEAPREEKFSMMNVPPQEQKIAEGIMMKIDKINFHCKLRVGYFGKREVFKKGLGVSGMFGAIKQFNATQLNGFKPDINKTHVVMGLKDFRTARKQNKLFINFRGRSPVAGSPMFFLNSEELATLFHFPYIEVKAPMVKKIDARKSAAPIGLPVDDTPMIGSEVPEDLSESPDDQLVNVIDYDTDFFENRFAKDKTRKTDRDRKDRIIGELEKEGKIDVQKVEEKAEEEANNFEERFSFEPVVKEEDVPARNGTHSVVGGRNSTNESTKESQEDDLRDASRSGLSPSGSKTGSSNGEKGGVPGDLPFV